MSGPSVKRLLMGKIAGAHGVRGMVKVLAFCEDPATLEKHGELFTSESGDKTISLTLKSTAGNAWLAAVEGINDRTAAEKLRGTELWLGRDKLPPVEEENSYYIADLMGLRVEDENGNTLGAVRAVENFGAGDLLDIQPASGDSFYLSFSAAVLRAVDIPGGRIVVTPPEDDGDVGPADGSA